MSKQINLDIPKGWNQCSTAQLEAIAAITREQIERVDRYHPFSMQKVKIALFFLFAGLKVETYPDPRLRIGEQFYNVSRASQRKRSWFHKLPFVKSHPFAKISFSKSFPFVKISFGKTKDSSRDYFSLYLWQITYWLAPKAKTDDKSSPEYITQGLGILDWLDVESGIYLTRFPYPFLRLRLHLFGRSKEFKGPSIDLDGFSWQQYRFASDMMQTYTRLSNNLIKMQQMDKFTEEQLMIQADSVMSARKMFLAIIFNAKTDYIDSVTGMKKHDFHYEAGQFTANSEYFSKISENQWQVVLFWWSGITHTLAHRYPHVFKVQELKNQKPLSPLEIYSATTATMQKYAGLTEDQVNTQSYSLVLEHLERLSVENEEMEKIRRNK